MNKTELNNVKNSLKFVSELYYYNTTGYNMATLKGMHFMLKSLNMEEFFYTEVNNNIIKLLHDDGKFNYIQLDTLLLLCDSIRDYKFKITEIIDPYNISKFIDHLSVLNDEIEFINKDTFTANTNKFKIIAL